MNHLDSLLSTSEKLLLNVKMNLDIKQEEHFLQSISLAELKSDLQTDDAKKTFWINIYNAYYQILVKKSVYSRKNIFRTKVIRIAQNYFSLDDIEHGILRRNRWKWSFGYLKTPFAPALLQDLEVETIDFRIHFALNCGAKSCPPIAFYNFEKIDQQLTNGTHSFLEQETTVDQYNKIISTSRLLHWYRADFGGIKGIKKTLQQVLSLNTAPYKIRFNPYSWESHLDNYL
jgi:hypothetical protein